MSLKKIFFLSILIRILVIPFFFHPDILWIYNSSLNLVKNGIINIYEYEASINDVLFKYPPFSYFFFGLYGIIISLFDSAVNWSSDWVSWLKNISVYRMLFIMKIPYLFADYIIAFYLYKYTNFNIKKFIIVWLFNPVIIYFLYVYGQFDILPALFMFLSFIFLLNNNKICSVIFFSISAAFKNYTLLFLPFWVLFLSDDLLSFIKIFSSIFILYLITILPFLFFQTFLDNVLFYSTSYIIGDKFYFSLENLYKFLFFAIYATIFLVIVFKRNLLIDKFNLLRVVIIILLLYYILFQYNPQFCIWLMPFLSFYFMKYSVNIIYFIIINLLFLNNLIPFGRNTFSIHFAPINSILYGLPSPASIINFTVGLQNYLFITNLFLYSIVILFLIKICEVRKWKI